MTSRRTGPSCKNNGLIPDTKVKPSLAEDDDINTTTLEVNPDKLNATSNAFQLVLSRITSVHQALDELKKFQFLFSQAEINNRCKWFAP